MQATSDANKAQRLKESLHFIGVTNTSVSAAATAAVAAKPGKKGAAAAASAAAAAPGPQPQRHTVFVDSAQEAREFDAAKYFDTPAELLDRTFNRPRKEQLADRGAVTGAKSLKGVEK